MFLSLNLLELIDLVEEKPYSMETDENASYAFRFL